MIKGVHDVYYNVTDMKRAVKFYSEVLNMKVAWESDHWTSMDCEGVMIGLHWTEGEVIPSTPRDAHGAHTGATLTLTSDNVSEDRKVLESAGAKILGEFDADWGHMLVFEDLDGNVLKLQNGKY
jgi:predicted enzyme related to lactoylglutathione lyase